MSKHDLALNGGPPVRTQPFTQWPVHDESEVEAVAKVIRGGEWWLNHCGAVTGEIPAGAENSQVVKFQRAFAAYHGANYGTACANGTAALEIALKALGVKPGDEVICPCYSFVATSNAILQVNAVPVFVDIEADTYNINPDLIEAKITERTVGIIPVHFAGQPANMAAVQAIADKHGLFVLEDAAHAHGSKYKDTFCGAIGDAATFSFQGSKNMTSGEGGIVLTNDKAIAEKVESLTWCGRHADAPWYQFFDLGWNYRITEFQSAILNCQLARLQEQGKRREGNATYLREALAQIPGLTPLVRGDDTSIHSWHLFILRYDDKAFGMPRADMLAALNAEGIPSISGYAFSLFDNPMYQEKQFWNCSFPAEKADYAQYRDECPVSEKACHQESVWLTQDLFLGERADMDDIIAAFQKIKDSV